MVEVVGPGLSVVAKTVDIPEVRNGVLLEIHVHGLGAVDEAVFVTAGEVKKLQTRAGSCRVGHEFGKGLGVGSEGESAEPGKGVVVGQADVQSLTPAHRKAGQGAMLPIG